MISNIYRGFTKKVINNIKLENCTNNICYCIEYLDFSQYNNNHIYNTCFYKRTINKENYIDLSLYQYNKRK